MINAIRIIVNRKCNFKCSYCCNDHPELTAPITKKTLDEIIKFANEHPEIETINITGGEPFLKGNENTIERLLTETDKYFYFYSNGSQYDEMVAFFKKNKLLIKNTIKGLNISFHKEYEKFFYNLPFKRLNWLVPVTIRMDKVLLEIDKKLKDDVDYLVKNKQVSSVRPFEMNKCIRDNEIIFEVDNG